MLVFSVFQSTFSNLLFWPWKDRDFNELIQREYEPVTFAKFHASQALTFRKHENLEDKQLVVNFKEQQCSIDYCEILTFACFRFTIRVKMF